MTAATALAFALFGALIARRVNPNPQAWLGGAVVCAFAGVLATLGLRWFLAALAGPARREHGFRPVSRAAGQGMVLLLSFAVLAAFAELVLGWSAVQAFAAAGLMGSAAAASAATVRLGAPPLRAAVLAGLWSLALSAGLQWVAPLLLQLGGRS